MEAKTDTPIAIRSFQSTDAAACRTLYLAGLLGGKLAENDTALDMDDIEGAYMKPGNHFWVAQNPGGEVVGMIGVQHFDEGTGQVRRLRVRKDHRGRGIGTALLETALKFCVEHQYLKIVFDTYMEREPAMAMFKKFHFRHDRTRQINGRDLMVFYLDLYTPERRKKA